MRALFLTSQRLISEHWPAMARMLEPVLDAARGEFTIDDLQELCRDGRALGGIGFHGDEPVLAWVIEWRMYPRKTTVNIIALAGRDVADAGSTFWPTFALWCRESGATEIEACVSPAMARFIRPLGFSHTYDLVRLPC